MRFRDDIECHWGGLKTPALEAGLAPSEIVTDWVWSLDAEKGVVTEEQLRNRVEREAKNGTPVSAMVKTIRHRLRRSVSLFNQLFEIPDIVASGLLPAEPISPPPAYDQQGRPKVSLPANLAQYQTCRPDPTLQGLPQVWQSMCGSGIFNLHENPSADDLLTSGTWTLIETLPHSVTGYAESTWRTYLLRTRATLLPHSPLSAPERLPERFEAMIEGNYHRRPIQALWRQICDYAPAKRSAGSDELLVPTTWCLLWHSVPDGVKANTWKQYETCARNILLRQGRYYVASYNHVTRAWADLPRSVKADLNPIRKVAEDNLLRPLDITLAWLTGLELDAVQRSHIEAALCDVFFSAVQVRCAEPLPDPVAAAWSVFRKTVRDEGLDGSRLGIIAKAATKDRKMPSALTHEWAVDVAEVLSDRGRRAKFSLATRNLDGMLSNKTLASLLYSGPIGALPDHRKRGMIDPPESMLRELAAVHEVFGRAHSTRREGRSVLRKLWTAAVATNVEVSGLDALLVAATTLNSIDRRTRSKGARLLDDLRSVQDVKSSGMASKTLLDEPNPVRIAR
jgi:hypothetical protein